MKGNLGRCLETRLAERPCHDVKWTWLMAVMKAYLTGLRASTWKYLASSNFVVS